MEYAEYGSLSVFIKMVNSRETAGHAGAISTKLEFIRNRFDAKGLVELISQLINGSKHLHDNGVSHLDLKPDNLLLAKVQRSHFGAKLLITDFGLAKRHDPSTYTAEGQLGTPHFQSPEQAFNSCFLQNQSFDFEKNTHFQCCQRVEGTHVP